MSSVVVGVATIMPHVRHHGKPTTTQKGPRFSPGPLHLPRQRGDDTIVQLLAGSPPLTRGTPCTSVPQSELSTDHPRVRGDRSIRLTYTVPTPRGPALPVVLLEVLVVVLEVLVLEILVLGVATTKNNVRENSD
jgi:hypothetical protein